MSKPVRWALETSHTRIGFSVRHFGISETEGHFKKYEGTIRNENDDFSDAEVELIIEVASIDTNDTNRDAHLASPDFFNAAAHPHITFKSTSMEPAGENQYKLHGDLSVNGVTKPVTLDVEFAGIVEKDPYGNTKAGLFIDGKINRKDWNVNWNANLDFGGVAVSDTVKIKCSVELLKIA